MRQSIRIAGQIRRSVFHEGWHGPAVLEVLEGLEAAKAGATTPIANHSIWELVQHMRCWQEVGIEAIAGKRMPNSEESDRVGWHEIVEISEKNWQIEVQRFRDSGESM